MCAFTAHVYGVYALANKKPKNKPYRVCLDQNTFAGGTVRIVDLASRIAKTSEDLG